MKTIYNKIGAALMGILLLASCQNRDLPGSGAMQLPTPDVTTISGTASGVRVRLHTIMVWCPHWCPDAGGCVQERLTDSGSYHR